MRVWGRIQPAGGPRVWGWIDVDSEDLVAVIAEDGRRYVNARIVAEDGDWIEIDYLGSPILVDRHRSRILAQRHACGHVIPDYQRLKSLE